MERRAHATTDGGLVDTVNYSQEEIRGLIAANDHKLASGQATADDMYELATVPGEFIEHWCHVNGVAWRDFMTSQTVQTDFINSDFAKPFRVWKGKF